MKGKKILLLKIMAKIKNIVIRSETKANEYRTPIVPLNIKNLINKGFIVYIEKSDTRCFEDKEYETSGAILIDKGAWKNFKYPESIIIGLKELNNYEDLDNHAHAYFSHFIKTVNPMLYWFKNSNSIIYDLEYLVDDMGYRKLAFGFYAGYIGALLGLLYYTDELENSLQPWLYEPEWKNKQMLKIALIGHKGRCGQGALSLMNKYKQYLQV